VRIALITEGTYPFVHGGVSVWCDHLIRRLPDVGFHVYAIAATTDQRTAWILPPNVLSMQTIGLEAAPGRRFGRIRQADRTRFLEALDQLLAEMLAVERADGHGFLDALRALRLSGRTVPLDIAMQSPEAFDLLRSRWKRHAVPEHLDRFGAPSLHNVLEVSSSLARFLRPLQVVPDGDVAHSTANGLGSLVALAGQVERGIHMLLTEHGVYLRERYLEDPAVDARVRAFQLLFFRHLNRACLSTADLILPVSDFNRRWELRTGADPERIHTIYNGVDPDSFPPQIGEPEAPTVSWVGRVDPLKDLRTLIAAFARVRRAVPGARLRLFGPTPDGNEAYHAACLRDVARHRLGDVVSFEGHISPVRLAHEAGHVVALSSISEGFPFTVLEAMMSGRATVSTDVGGVGEAVGPTGLLVPPRDPERFAEELIRLLTDDELRRRLGRAARERALALFTLGRMTSLYQRAYEAAIYGEPFVPNAPALAVPGGAPVQVHLSFVHPYDEKRAAGGRP
jgi:glycosyltransferase involved in cell wall biosynthesis